MVCLLVYETLNLADYTMSGHPRRQPQNNLIATNHKKKKTKVNDKINCYA